MNINIMKEICIQAELTKNLIVGYTITEEQILLFLDTFSSVAKEMGYNVTSIFSKDNFHDIFLDTNYIKFVPLDEIDEETEFYPLDFKE